MKSQATGEMHRLRAIAVTLALGWALAACSSGPGSTSLGLPSAADLTVGALPSLATRSSEPSRVTGSPIELYTRIARGAVTCWFGSSGPLKGTYVYHAEADPPSKGGRAEIVIHTKDPAVEDPRSLRAFHVAITPDSDAARLEVENHTIAEPLATRMKGDVSRWAAKEEGCGTQPMTTGWSPRSVSAARPVDKGNQKTSDK
ncbi:MAG TPA: hypothetical protein VJ045_02745 [Hyphomicrobiaceae bacterium]|nr:hypothetical protein [Hyphomicrobiaceae bacterium]